MASCRLSCILKSRWTFVHLAYGLPSRTPACNPLPVITADVASDKIDLMTTGQKILYLVFITTSILFGLFLIWFNVEVIVDNYTGHVDNFRQMYSLTDEEWTWYSVTFLIQYLTLLTLGTYFAFRHKKMKAVICYILLFATFGLELYFDRLFLISV